MVEEVPVEVLMLVIGALVGALVGYFVRRGENLRDRRIDAAKKLSASFLDAARTGATLASIHMQTGFPENMDKGRPDAEKAAEAHGAAWKAAIDARNRFEEAATEAKLVALKGSGEVTASLREFLQQHVYSRPPWNPSINPRPKKGGDVLSPAAIERLALELIGEQSTAIAREMWGWHAPKPKD